MAKKSSFIWSDNWWIEDNTAWFVYGEKNILLCIDMNKNECNFVAELPFTSENKFRLNPRCIKCGNDIFCMPDIGEYIWVYNLDTLQFKQIEVDNPNNERLSITNFWKIDEKIFAVSIGLRQIIEIGIVEKRIVNYYSLTTIPEERIALSIKVDNSIYILSAVSNQVYEFDLETKSTTVYTIPDIKGGLRTMCFDGENFWLSGFRKEIYIWNKESDTVKVINEFPQQFGIYSIEENEKLVLDCDVDFFDTPVFIDSIAIEKDIWFVPYQANKVVYVDKDTYEICILEIEDEEETEKSFLGRGLVHKYLLEYILDNRYIGLFSLKNNYILEIDTAKKESKKKDCIFSKRCLQRMLQPVMKCQKAFTESNIIDKALFKYQLMGGDTEKMKKSINIGYDIQKAILK